MIVAHRICLDPTFKQEAYFRQCAGVSRFVWNKALAEWERQHAEGEKPSGMQLKKDFNQTKYEEFPWLREVHRDCHSQPFANLQKAYKAFFEKRANKPAFKKKGKTKDSFYVSNDKFRVQDKHVILPKIGRVRLRETLRFVGKITSAAVSRTADKWFISVQVKVPEYKKLRVSDNITGIDIGLKSAATLSDGTVVDLPFQMKSAFSRIKRCQRRLSRQVQGSNNRSKTKSRLSRLWARFSAIRHDWLHKLTTKLCRENQTVVIEDLAVKNMVKNRKLAPAISFAGWWGEFRRQLEYKSSVYTTKLVVVDRFFPSSKMCSQCGHVKDELKLSQRTYRCDQCGLDLDRDLNAALNLRAAGLAGIACEGRLAPVEAGTKMPQTCLRTN